MSTCGRGEAAWMAWASALPASTRLSIKDASARFVHGQRERRLAGQVDDRIHLAEHFRPARDSLAIPAKRGGALRQVRLSGTAGQHPDLVAIGQEGFCQGRSDHPGTAGD